MRTRLLRPSFFDNAELLALPPLTRLFFAGLWCMADREGRLLDQPARLRLKILPGDVCSGEELLSQLAAGDPPFVVRYQVGKQRLLWLPGFRKQQGWGIHYHERDSVLPPCELDACNDCSTGLVGTFTSNGVKCRSGDSETPRSGDSEKEELPSEVCPEPVPKPASGPAVLTFPTVGKGPREWKLTEGKLAEYRESFPGVEVLAECRKALQWCRDNPAKRKTARGMPSFLTRWLGKTQNAGASGPRKSREQSRQEVLDEWLRQQKSTPPG